MVSIKVSRSKLSGVLRCPSSKSYTHRAIAIASLAIPRKNLSTSVITNPLLARDTLATLSACRALGAEIKNEDGKLKITGKQSFDPPENVINAENSGTTIRIITAMSGLVRKGFTILTGDDSLRRRPMQPILDALQQLGVECYSTKLDGTPPLVVQGGGIKGGRVVVDGSISSQFISGLLISGIHASEQIEIKIRGNLVSRPYVGATLATMTKFGVSVGHSDDLLEYHLKNDECYRPAIFDVPSDFSAAALLLAAGILAGGKLVVKGLNFDLPQGDSKIIEIIQELGGRIKVERQKGQVTAEGTEILEGGNFDLSDTPDLLPVVSVLALKASAPITISGVAHARLKETDRVANIARELRKFGVSIKEFGDGLSIAAPKQLKNAKLNAYNDHRLFMAFTIASMITEHSLVGGAESVDVSYPTFLEDMKHCGAAIQAMPDREGAPKVV